MLFVLTFIALSLFFIFLFFNKIKKAMFIVIASLAFLAYGGISFYNAEKNYSNTFDGFYNQTVTIEGYVDSEIESSSDGKIKFFMKTNKIIYEQNEKEVIGKLLINTSNNSEYFEKNNAFVYRAAISFTGNIEKPKPAVNPGGFNYKRYLAGLGVSGAVYLRNISDIDLIGNKGGGWINKLGFSIKNYVLGIVEFCLDKNQAGLLAGMIIGYKDGLDENAYNAFSKAGLTHIMVASGMNVAFIILPLTYIFKKMRIGNAVSSILIIAVLILFVFVAGFSASVVRAVIMGIIILVGKLVMRETDIFTSISAAAIILLFINPYTLFDIGFQLSFAATISLVMFYQKIKECIDNKYLPNIISDTLAATLAAQIGVIPITLYYFNNLSTISIISNLLVVPVVQMITIIGFIMVFAGIVNINLAVLIGYINNTFLSFVLFITESTAKLSYASLKLPTPPLWIIVFYYIAVLYIFKWRYFIKNKQWFRYVKYICLALTIIIIIIKNIIPKPLEITYLDVGQGDCTFIRTAHGTKVFIDGGGKSAGSKSTYDVGESVVVPYILDQGTKKIDIVIATHGHSDHTEGLEAILKEMSVGMVILPDTDGKGFERLINLCNQKKINIVECKKGDIIRLDEDTVFDVLSPMKFEQDVLSQQSLNNSSLVLKLKYKNFKALFQGDAEVPIEQRMIEQGLDLSTDILKVGHHGSYSSTSEEFVKQLKSKYAVISVGKNNFGHPSQFVVDRLTESGILPLRTDERGAVIVTSYGEGASIKTMLYSGNS
ncbi:DNA internalization-related competence protein ComEC/Rec2 [Ruminiclostridium herbifermentans]|uniref:DNA internalization-related competence protein ComEC/Rec2 n=2 Tax=Ruminiclostridium herbifermentans TaxID=2488810 RepID=A0A4U7JDY7_9FIRM|nr:DNA internalization-related competence protein ComEC/Rec2 [Ruminiclostridium herbifermentans]